MRYTLHQLQQMAQHALAERDRGSALWDLLVIRLTLQTGMRASDVELHIEQLARGRSWA